MIDDARDGREVSIIGGESTFVDIFLPPASRDLSLQRLRNTLTFARISRENKHRCAGRSDVSFGLRRT